MISNLIIEKDLVQRASEAIVLILAAERDSQKLKAIAEGKNPALWDFDLFADENLQYEEQFKKPIVNVWAESMRYNQKGSTNLSLTVGDARIWIECYGFGTHRGGKTASTVAMDEAVRITTLCRQIIGAAQYLYLGSHTLTPKSNLMKRWISTVTYKQAGEDGDRSVVLGAIEVYVNGEDVSQQATGETLESLYFQYDIMNETKPVEQEIIYAD